MLNKKSVDDINVKGKKVLVRCDFNVPLKEGRITDENRLVAALPTIKKLIADGGRVILCSHLGKPKGEPKPELSLAPVAARLTELLGQEVKFAADPEVVGPNAKAAAGAMKDGEVILLENTRYRAEETKNGEAFSKDLASLCEVYVNDAFGTAHRAHCSNVGVTQYVDTAVVGYLMQKEIDFLGNAVNNPVRPFVAILGGAKVADKLNVISNLLEKCDTLIIGGGMAFTFLKAQGREIGKSLVDDTKLDYCREMMEKAEKLGKKLLLPIDTTIAASFPSPIDGPIEVSVVSSDAIPADMEGLDIGTETAKLYADAVKSAKTVVWNGPMGVFENPTLAKGNHRGGGVPGRDRSHDHHRRRRFRGGSQPARLRRQDDPHLHRRRRFPGILRGQGASGRGGCERQIRITEINIERIVQSSERGERRWQGERLSPATGR